MAKTLTMRLDDETYETFVRAAQAERRSLANLVEAAALRHIQESLFVDDAEMAEILSRPGLVKRLKAVPGMPKGEEAGHSSHLGFSRRGASSPISPAWESSRRGGSKPSCVIMFTRFCAKPLTPVRISSD